MYPALDLYTAFDSHAIEDGELRRTRHRVRRVSAGALRVPSGRIVAADPFLPRDAFTTVVPPGTYPVELLLATYRGETGETEEQVWFARVVFRRERPSSWSLAVVPGEDVTQLGRGQVFTYGVDSGTASFADAGLSARIAGDAVVHDHLNDELQRAGLPWIIRYGDADADLVAFTSGDGDGSYASWFGLDAAGAPVCLVTDFGHGDFPRPPGNPAPEQVAAAIAGRIDALLTEIAAGPPASAAARQTLAEACYDLLEYAETGDHLERLLVAMAAAPEPPPPFVMLVGRVAFGPAGQPLLASWLSQAPPAAIDRLLCGRDAGRCEFLGAELAVALRGLHASRRVPVASLVQCARRFVVGTEAPLLPILRAGLLDEQPRVRRRALDVLVLLCRDVALPAEVRELVIATCDDPDPRVAARAVRVVVAMGAPRRLLRRLLDHDTFVVRAHAALQLGADPPWGAGRTIEMILRAAALAPELDAFERSDAAALVGDPDLDRRREAFEDQLADARAAAHERGEPLRSDEDDLDD